MTEFRMEVTSVEERARKLLIDSLECGTPSETIKSIERHLQDLINMCHAACRYGQFDYGYTLWINIEDAKVLKLFDAEEV